MNKTIKNIVLLHCPELFSNQQVIAMTNAGADPDFKFDFGKALL